MLVLVVDDYADIASATKYLLQAHGLGAESVNSAVDALAYIRTHPTDMMVVDQMMPLMTGLDLLAIVKADPALTHIPFLLYTAFYDPKVQTEAFRLGASDVIYKEHDSFQKILQAVSKHRPVSERVIQI